MADIDKLMDFLQKEVPSNAEDLNNSINTTLEIIERTRAAVMGTIPKLCQNERHDEVSNFTDADRQLSNFQHKLQDFLDNKMEEPVMTEEAIIEEDDSADIPEDENEEKIEEREGKIDYKKYLVDNTKPYPLSVDFENTTPDSFSFKGEKQKVKNYKDMWVELCKILYSKNADIFAEIATWRKIRGRMKPYIAYEDDIMSKNITNPLRFMNTGIVLEGTTSTTQKIKIIAQMLEIYKISPSTVKVYLKSDRRPKHGQEPIGIYKDKSFDYKEEIKKNLKIDDNSNECTGNNSDISTGKRVYGYLQDYFKDTSLSYNIQNLLDSEWCKETFNISYPLLKEYDESKNIKEQTIPEGKTGAYYAQNPILHINNKSYIIYMQWDNKRHRNRVEKWISDNPISNFIQDTNIKMDVYVLPKNKTKICEKCNKKTLMDHLLLTYSKSEASFQKDFHIRRCRNCDLIFMSDGTYNMYINSSDTQDPNVNFIFK